MAFYQLVEIGPRDAFCSEEDKEKMEGKILCDVVFNKTQFYKNEGYSTLTSSKFICAEDDYLFGDFPFHQVKIRKLRMTK